MILPSMMPTRPAPGKLARARAHDAYTPEYMALYVAFLKRVISYLRFAN